MAINFAGRAGVQTLFAKDPSLKDAIGRLDRALNDGVVTSKTLNDELLPALRAATGHDGFVALAEEVGETVKVSEHDPRIETLMAELARRGSTFEVGSPTGAPPPNDVEAGLDIIRTGMQTVEQMERDYSNAGMNVMAIAARLAPTLYSAADARDALKAATLPKLESELLSSVEVGFNALVQRIVDASKSTIDYYFKAAEAGSMVIASGPPSVMLEIVRRFEPQGTADAYADKVKVVLDFSKTHPFYWPKFS
jgi:hypothetical protein